MTRRQIFWCRMVTILGHAAVVFCGPILCKAAGLTPGATAAAGVPLVIASVSVLFGLNHWLDARLVEANEKSYRQWEQEFDKSCAK